MTSKQMQNNPIANERIGELMMSRYAEMVRKESQDVFVAPKPDPQDKTALPQTLDDPYRGVTMKTESDPEATKI